MGNIRREEDEEGPVQDSHNQELGIDSWYMIFFLFFIVSLRVVLEYQIQLDDMEKLWQMFWFK